MNAAESMGQILQVLYSKFHGNTKNQESVGSKWDESTKENSKTKIDKIRSQQIRESCGIQPVNEEENGTNI